MVDVDRLGHLAQNDVDGIGEASTIRMWLLAEVGDRPARVLGLVVSLRGSTRWPLRLACLHGHAAHSESPIKFS